MTSRALSHSALLRCGREVLVAGKANTCAFTFYGERFLAVAVDNCISVMDAKTGQEVVRSIPGDLRRVDGQALARNLCRGKTMVRMHPATHHEVSV